MNTNIEPTREQWRCRNNVMDTLIERGRVLEQMEKALVTARESVAAAVRLGADYGMTESEMSRYAGVTRDSVRRWLGK